MNKVGKIFLSGAFLVGGAILTLKGVKEIGDVIYDIPSKPTPKIILGVVKPVEEVVEAATSES